mmetsp:Transcript_13608/g.20406  ORF Transcript_13608/g.20406 Transcript_13608/m.20406 type:complete len:219 (-) Transcript_13608:608-1264(-)
MNLMTGRTLLGVLSLGKRVQQSATHSDGRSDSTDHTHGSLEHDATRHDDNNTLQSVGNRVGDRRQLLKSQKGSLIVKVESQTREQRVLQNILASAHLHHLIVNGSSILDVEHSHKRQSAQQSQDSHHGVSVLGTQSLGPGLAHHTLGHHVLQGGGLVGKRGGDKSGPGEGQFLQRGQSDTSNNGDQGCVHHRVVNVLEQQGIGSGCEDRLPRLNDLSE